MSKYYRVLFFLAFLFPFFSVSQNYWEGFVEFLESDNLTVRKIKKRLKKLDSKDIVYLESDYYSYGHSFNMLYNDFECSDFEFFKFIDSNSDDYYQMRLFLKKRKVIYLELINVQDSVIEKKIVKKEFYDLIEIHNKKMKIKADTTHKFFNPNYKVVFNSGYECEGHYYIEKCWKFVENKDREELIKWCHSLSPEIRFYGVYGFFMLKNEGLKLSEEEERLFNLIIKEKTSILYCDSCEGNNASSIKELIHYLIEEYNQD